MINTNESNKNHFYYVYGLAVATLVTALLLSNPVAIVLSAMILLISVILLNSSHIINSMLIKRSKIIEIAGAYKLSSNLNAVSARHGSSFRSISVAFLHPRPNYTIKNEAVKDLLDSICEHFEFSIELVEVNKAQIIENLKTRLRLKEISLSRMDSKHYDKINAIKRQIDLINGDINSMLSGGKSFQFAIKIKSIYTSENENEAEFYSARNIEILGNKFSAALGLDNEILKGERLLQEFGA